MAWEIEVTDEFRDWFAGLSEDARIAITRTAELLETKGPALGRPYAETLAKQSKLANLKELRVAFHGDAYRILFAYDPRQVAVFLLGDRKPDSKWYKKAIPAAERIHARYLEELRLEGLLED